MISNSREGKPKSPTAVFGGTRRTQTYHGVKHLRAVARPSMYSTQTIQTHVQMSMSSFQCNMSYVKLGMHNTGSDALDCLDLLLILPLFFVGVVDFSMPNFFFNSAIEFKILAPPSGSLFMMRNCLLILSKVLSCLRSTLTSILSVTTSEISSSILWHGR